MGDTGMKVLVGCECSGVVRRAFRKRGHDAWSCDVQPADDGSKYHFQKDVLELLDIDWDLGIFHPPCTFILNSGCKHLYVGGKRFLSDGTESPRDMDRWQKMEQGARFFKQLLFCNIPKVACENPVMVGHALKIVGKNFNQKIQPWYFGHAETKATCLWLRNIPPLEPTKLVYNDMMKLPKKERHRIHYMGQSDDRGKLRSVTFSGIAEAMAEQWGVL